MSVEKVEEALKAIEYPNGGALTAAVHDMATVLATDDTLVISIEELLTGASFFMRTLPSSAFLLLGNANGSAEQDLGGSYIFSSSAKPGLVSTYRVSVAIVERTANKHAVSLVSATDTLVLSGGIDPGANAVSQTGYFMTANIGDSVRQAAVYFMKGTGVCTGGATRALAIAQAIAAQVGLV